MDASGSTLERIGHFRILGLLGRGGMGVVYKALDESLERVVALKVLPASGPDDEERRQRFLREARFAARVTHPAIVGIYEVGAADGRLYIAMELIEGQSLRNRLSQGPLPVAQAIDVALEVASALEKAHESGITHRDLKPDNVMLTKDGHAKVLDFGIARLGDALQRPGVAELLATEAPLTREGQVIGTPGYMSPEQTLGAEVDARSDIFSFGVCVYEMLAGTSPWSGPTPMAIMLAAARDEPRPLSGHVNAPAPLVELVQHCLERDRNERCSSAHEIVERLSRAKELLERGEAPTDLALTAPPAKELVPGASKRPFPTRSAAVVASVLVAVAVVGLALGPRERASPEPAAAASQGPVTLATQQVSGCGPGATADVQSGLLALREAAWNKAAKHFEKATLGDPNCAVAFLRLAIVDDGAPGSTRRARFQRAAELREKLTPRDRALLDVYEPELGRDPPVPSERKQRALKLVEQQPNDAEFLSIAGWFVSNEDVEWAEKLVESAVRVDPGYFDAWQSLGRLRWLRGDAAGAKAALDRCVTGSAVTTDCVYERIRIGRASLAACRELEPDARLWLARENTTPHGSYFMALVLAGQGERDAAEKALVPRWSAMPQDRRGVVEKREAAQLALLFGDVAAGDRLVSELLERLRDRNELVDRAHYAILAVDLAIESGDVARARQIAETSARELPAWSRASEELLPRVGFWFEPWLLAKRLELGALRRATGRELDRWRALDDTRNRPPLVRWALGEALVAVEPGAAKEAVKTFPPDAKPDVSDHSFITNYAIGKTLLLADRASEAEPFLRTATRRCDGFELPLIHLSAQLLHARALERTRDVPGACAAHRTLLERWGSTKPLLVSAAAARARSAALGCDR